MVAAEEEAVGGEVVAVAVTTLSLIGTTHLMASSMEWTALTS